jgi:LytS/YehU family sensor histidine kinase
MKSILFHSRIWLHIGFWLSILFVMVQFDVDILVVFYSMLVLMVPVYVCNTFLVNYYYKKRKYLHFVLGMLLLVFVYTLFVYWLPATIYKKDKDDLFTIYLDLLFFTVFAASIKIGRYSFYKEKEYAAIQIQQLQSELSLLKAQVNPHFLFNTLNNVYGLILQQQTNQAAEVTLKLSDLMRYMLESSKLNLVLLRKEIKFIEDYLSLERIRLSPTNTITFEVSRVDREIFIPPLLFIPLVENAFKHGLQNQVDAGCASFHLTLQQHELYFEAINTKGNSLQRTEVSGTGLENLTKRLQLLYPDKHTLQIEESAEMFKVILHITV